MSWPLLVYSVTIAEEAVNKEEKREKTKKKAL